MIKIKICGLMRIEDVKYANELKPDYIGFIFAEGRRRTISVETAKLLKQALNSDIKAVGVFLDQDIEYVKAVVEAECVDVIQLHGNESEEYISEVRSLGVPVIKAFTIDSEKAADRANKSIADFILLDNKLPGSGQTFDWSYLKHINRDYFLAGGINISNAAEAMSQQPYALDISSGVETAGIKDCDKMKQFIDIVRG